MRKVIAVLMVMLLCGAASAQTSPVDKGSWLINGQGGFTSTGMENEDDRLTQVSVSAGPGTFVSPGLLVGGEVLFNSASQGGDSYTMWGLGPKIVYFPGANKEKELPGAVYPYVGASFSMIGASNGDSETGTQIKFGGGIMYMVTRSNAFSVEALYQLQSINNVSVNTFAILFGFSFFIWER
jgi:hypothetical protein